MRDARTEMFDCAELIVACGDDGVQDHGASAYRLAELVLARVPELERSNEALLAAAQAYVAWADAYEKRATEAKPPFDPWDPTEKPLLEALRAGVKR